MTFSHRPKFVRQYGDAAALIRTALTDFRHDVEMRSFPSEDESDHLPKKTTEALESHGRPVAATVASFDKERFEKE
jgi:3-methyl-2-oxobutanoate hydroxymethyltransferase